MSRRQQIMDVAAELFASRGFHRVTVDELCAALGVSGPALYHHFASKEALLGDMLVSISEELLAGGRSRVEHAATPDEALVALLRCHPASTSARVAPRSTPCSGSSTRRRTASESGGR